MESNEENIDREDMQGDESPVPQEVLEEASHPMRVAVRESFSMVAGRMANPLIKKITSEHIDKMIENSSLESEREYRLRSSNRWFTLIYFFLAIIVFGGITVWVLPSYPDLYVDILSYFGTAIAGFFGGWGFHRIRG